MYLIIIVAFAIVLFYQNSKINRLENLIKKNILNQAVRPSASAPQATVNSTSPVSQTVSTPVQNPANVPNGVQPGIAVSSKQPSLDKVQASSEETSGKILGRIGIGAVVVGMAFFLKYAFDNNWVGPSGRVLIGIIIGVIVLALGQWLRKKYLGYSDLLMGGGLAILYISFYSSYALYSLTDPMITFLAMIVVTAIGVALSITNATKTLSTISFIGGFFTFSLIGMKEIDAWIMFAYITILNLGILGILLYKKWSHLTIVGLLGTWIYFGAWLSDLYTDDYLMPTLFFVLLQFLIFTGASAVRILIEKLKAVEIDYFILTATAVSFAGICYELLMPEYKHFVSIGSVVVSLFYFAFALFAYRRNPDDRTLNIFLPGLAVAFLTVAIPIEFSGPWIVVLWLIQSIVLYVVALKSSSRGFQMMGAIVYVLGILGLINYLVTYQRPEGFVIFFNVPFMILIFTTAISFAIAYIYYRYGSISKEIQKQGIVAYVIMANIILLYALTAEVNVYYKLQFLESSRSNSIYLSMQNWTNTTTSILWALYATLLTVIGFAKRHPMLRRMGLILFIVTALKVFANVWQLGEIYRVISFIAFGVIALIASFLYVKYKDRLKEIV